MVDPTPRHAESLLAENGTLRPGWKTAFGSLLCLTVGPSVIVSLCFGVFAPHLREAFGWTVAQVAVAVSIMSISVMAASVLSGPIIDRFGVRRVVLTFIPLFGLAFASMGLQNGALWQFYLAWALIPVIGIGLWPGSWAKATAGWFSARLGLAVAIATIGVGVGAAFMPFVINGVAESQGWRMAYALVGLGSILVAFPAAYFWVREAPVDAHRAAAGLPADDRGFWALFQDIRLTYLCLGFLALGLFSAAVLSNLVLILESNGMQRHEAVIAQSIIGLATIAGRILCGWMLDKAPFRVVVPAFCFASAIAVVTLAGGASGTSAFLAAAVIGMMIGAEIDLLGYAIQRLFGRARYATLFGVIFGLFQVGGAGGAMMMGATHTATGAFALGLFVAGGACAFAGALFALMPFARVADRPAPLATAA